MSSELKNVVLVILLIFCLTGCLSDSNAETPLQNVPFTVIVSGQNPVSGVNENRKIEVLKDQPSLDAHLALYVQFIQQYIVDFSTKRVVFMNLGQRNTGGYSIATSGVQEFGDYVLVSITITKPASNCAVTQSFTSPFEFIEVQSTKEILFTEQLVITSCN